MAKGRNQRVMLVLALFLAAAIFVPPFVRLNRYQKELENSLGNALGRKVHFLGDINFRIFPQPGIVAQNFVVEDDPAFGAEPMLRAETAIASLRLASLWRGRFEIARLSFDYPSWNLVRNPQGRWNLESLLQRTSQVQTAPTSLTRVQAAPRFPYIEADNGRINFKLGDIKIAHALLDSDFALWQESEDEWNLRYEGRLTRTDSNLSDTGTLRADGSFTRSHGEPLEQTPFKLRLELERGQLGQLTSLFTGRDRGWRGNIDGSATLVGSLQNLKVQTQTELRDFRRFDLVANDFMKADLRCSATISKNISFGFHANDIACELPVNEGKATISGSFALNGSPQYQLRIVAHQLPVAPLASLYRRAKYAVPDDFTASGTLSGTFDFNRAESEPGISTAFTGTVTGLSLGSPSLQTQFEIGRLGLASIAAPTQKSRRMAQAIENWLVLDPVGLDLGGKQPVVASIRISGRQLVAELEGSASVSRLLAAAKTFGLAYRDYNAEGDATLDLVLIANWGGFAPPTSTGVMQLRQLTLGAPGIASPLQLASASVRFTPNDIIIDRIDGSWERTRTNFAGLVRIPRVCPRELCPAYFDLRTTELELDDVNRQFNPKFRNTDWLAVSRRLIGGDQPRESLVSTMAATGKIAVERLVLKQLVGNRVTAAVTIRNGVMEASDVRGELLGGHHLGRWTADFTQNPPAFHGSGVLENASVPQITLLMRDNFATGTIGGDYSLTFSGDNPGAVLASAKGEVRFAWRNGILRRLTADGNALAFSSWTGSTSIEDGKLRLTNGRMQTRVGSLLTSGTVSFTRNLELAFAGERQTYVISGSIEKPLVEIQTSSASTIAAVPASNPKDAKVQSQR
jgi:hypothetical protein